MMPETRNNHEEGEESCYRLQDIEALTLFNNKGKSILKDYFPSTIVAKSENTNYEYSIPENLYRILRHTNEEFKSARKELKEEKRRRRLEHSYIQELRNDYLEKAYDAYRKETIENCIKESESTTQILQELLYIEESEVDQELTRRLGIAQDQEIEDQKLIELYDIGVKGLQIKIELTHNIELSHIEEAFWKAIDLLIEDPNLKTEVIITKLVIYNEQ